MLEGEEISQGERTLAERLKGTHLEKNLNATIHFHDGERHFAGLLLHVKCLDDLD